MDTPQELANQPVQGPADPARPKGLTVGRNCHYVTRQGLHLAAIVADVEHREGGIITLAVFDPHANGVNFYDRVPYDPSGQQIGSWHYIEPVE